MTLWLCAIFILKLISGEGINVIFEGVNLIQIDWLKELLSGVDINWIYDNETFKTALNKSIIVVNTGYRPKTLKLIGNYFEKLKDLRYKFGVILLGEFECNYPFSYLSKSQFIFKNYWHEKYKNNDKVVFFPLGYKHGFLHQSLQINDCFGRKFIWSFAGAYGAELGKRSSSRDIMVKHMKSIPRHHLLQVQGWGNNSEVLSVEDYRNLLLNTIFVPCPAGSSLETLRVWEALECGCIPIVEKFPTDYYNLFLGNHPFLAVDSWQQAVDEVNALLIQPSKMEALRLECQTWWQDYKIQIKALFTRTITNGLLKSVKLENNEVEV